MSELKWNWVYYPYLDAPNKQEESALQAGYIKVVDKDEADKVLAEKDKEIAELKDKTLQYKVLYKEKCRDINTQERFFAEKMAHDKYKRCLAMAKMCELKRIDAANYRIPREKWEFYKKWHKRWLELAEEFKECV